MRSTATLLLFYSINVLYPFLNTCSADDDYVVIQEIKISGNKKTKEHIILRELLFVEGDTIPALSIMRSLEGSRENIINTHLFLNVEVLIDNWEGVQVEVSVEVVERWYFFPFPIFELADRNFNVWWVDHSRDFSRTEWGLRLIKQNNRGRNEELQTKIQSGYTRKYELFYDIPYIDNQLRYGARFAISYSRNRQIAYATDFNKEQFYEDEDYIRSRFYARLNFSRRRKFYNKHRVRISYHHNVINDTISVLNENYFADSSTIQRYFTFRYAYQRDHRDIKAYPLKGSLLAFEVNKKGLAVFRELDLLDFKARYQLFLPLKQHLFLSASIKAKISLPVKQPWYNQIAFGYNQDFVRGYEYYVVDGQSFVLNKWALKYQLLALSAKSPGTISTSLRSFPLGIYLKFHFDMGYVQDDFFVFRNSNFLENSLLLGSGLGIDFVTFYEIVLRLEYSWNKLKEHGLFIHFKSAF